MPLNKTKPISNAEYSRFFLLFLTVPIPFPIFCKPLQVHQLLLASPLSSSSTAFFSSLARCKNLSIFSFSFNFTPLSSWTAISTRGKFSLFLFFFVLSIITLIYWRRDFVLFILPFVLVKLSTFCLAHGLLRCNLSAGIHARARRGCVIQKCQNETTDRPWGFEWRHAPEACVEDFGGFEKRVELSFAVRRRRVTFASSQWSCGGCRTYWWRADGKASIEILCLSLLMSKNL